MKNSRKKKRSLASTNARRHGSPDLQRRNPPDPLGAINGTISLPLTREYLYANDQELDRLEQAVRARRARSRRGIVRKRNS